MCVFLGVLPLPKAEKTTFALKAYTFVLNIIYNAQMCFGFNYLQLELKPSPPHTQPIITIESFVKCKSSN